MVYLSGDMKGALPLPTTLPDYAELVPTMLIYMWNELEFSYVVCQPSPSLCLAVFVAREFSKIFLG
jgi:hypothetical protein